MSTMSKLLRKGEMPVELAKNFDVSESAEFCSALDCYNFQQKGQLIYSFASIFFMLIAFVWLASPVLTGISTQVASLFFVMGLLSTISFIIVSIGDKDVRNFRKFDKGLGQLLLTLKDSSESRDLHLMSYKELGEQARKVLVEHAYSIHYAKVVGGETEDMLLGRRTQLKFIYDGLRWYGLIPMGGYHPYYAEAEKRLAAERAPKPSEPVPASSS